MNHPIVKLCWLSFVFILIMPKSYALPDDRQQKMHLRADSAEINHQTHCGVYLGHIELDQGSTHLRAAEAMTQLNEHNKLIKAIAKGSKSNQAHYWSISQADKPPIHAYADTIIYYPEKHLIELTGNASIEQGDNTFKAPTIRIDTEKQHVLTARQGQERTTIIFTREDKL